MMDYNPRHWNIPGADRIPDITERHDLDPDYENVEDAYIALDEPNIEEIADEYVALDFEPRAGNVYDWDGARHSFEDVGEEGVIDDCLI